MSNLKEIVRAEMDRTQPVILNFPWHDKKAYGMWLAQTFHMVNHSTRLVALAGAHTPIEQNSLHARFVDHSKEERGHEKVCTTDLKNLGFQLSDFPCLVHSASMYQVQYYWIQFRGPTSFFGYTLALECLAENFGPELYRKTSTAHGENTAKFLKLHSEDDVEHIQSAFEQLNKLSPPELALVIENLTLSSEIYRNILRESEAWAKQSAPPQKLRQAA